MNIELITGPINALLFYLQGAEDVEKDPQTSRIYNLLSFRLTEILDLLIKVNDPAIETEVNMYEMKEPGSTKKKSKADIIIKRKDEPSLESIINDIPKDRLNLRQRILTSLQAGGIDTLDKLLNCTCSHLISIPNFSRKSLDKILEALKSNGYKLND